MKSDRLRVGLLWHSLKSGNLGVDALTVANLEILREVARNRSVELVPVVIGMADSGGSRMAGIDQFDMTWRTLLSPGGYWKQLGRLDCLVDIGLGDSFAEIYGAKRFAMLWLTKVLAILRGKPLLLAPQTIGPFTRPAYRALAKLALDRATAVIARDDMSMAEALALAPAARVLQATDVAFKLPFADRSAERGGARRRIGINVSGLLFHQAETGKNRFGLGYDYAAAMRSLISRLTERDDVEVFLLTHANSSVSGDDDDRAICDRLAAEFPAAVRVPDFVDAPAAKSFISSLDVLIAARMHACIAAMSSGTPFVPIAYSRKFEGLFGSLGYHVGIPPGASDVDAVVAEIDGLIDRRDDLRGEIALAMACVESRLGVYREEIDRLMDNCRSSR